MGPLQRSRVKIRGHIIAHRTPLSPRTKSGEAICNPSIIRRLDTWRHGARDHSTCHRPVGLPTYRRSVVTKSLSPAIFKIMGTRHFGVTILTFQCHVISSFTWPFNSQVAISYRCSTVTKSLSPAVSEIMDNGHQRCRGHELDLSRSRDVIGHVTIGLGVDHFCHRDLLMLKWGLLWQPGSGRLNEVQYIHWIRS